MDETEFRSWLHVAFLATAEYYQGFNRRTTEHGGRSLLLAVFAHEDGFHVFEAHWRGRVLMEYSKDVATRLHAPRHPGLHCARMHALR